MRSLAAHGEDGLPLPSYELHPDPRRGSGVTWHTWQAGDLRCQLQSKGRLSCSQPKALTEGLLPRQLS